jgi:pectate lyase
MTRSRFDDTVSKTLPVLGRAAATVFAWLSLSCGAAQRSAPADAAPALAGSTGAVAAGTAGIAAITTDRVATAGQHAVEQAAPAAGTSATAGRIATGGVAGMHTDTAGTSSDAGSSATAGQGDREGAAGAGGAAAGSCTTPPPAGPLLGWASVPGSAATGISVATTTGGGDAAALTVTTLAALNAAVGGSAPAVIYVKGVLAAGTVKVGSNKTIAGVCGAELHGHVDMSGSANIIFRNLKVVGYNCSDNMSECKSGLDAITVVTSAHHIWFDHDDISDGSDGNLDITNGSDFVTVSWTKFSYSTKRTDPVTGSTGHRFSNLIGAADGVAEDAGHLNVTWHHNWWADNIAERMPRSRDGKIHVTNNLFTARGNDYCSNSGNLSSLLVENNVYIGVANPLQEDADGNMLARGNVFQATSGTTTSKGTGFTPPYTLTPDPTSELAATIMKQAGPQP